MIKPIGPQYIAAKKNQRVGLTHVSSVIDRLMRIYGLQDELDALTEQQELEAAQQQTAEFEGEPEPVHVMAAAAAGSQATFSWFE